ncbi:MAG TPA: ABC transporter ATP-binding protein, partial [Candidatus Limnocylindrales bacterium]|nr:ABC transporter ATP-binding protein [Candidatus Limnocylindrales bacterium]
PTPMARPVDDSARVPNDPTATEGIEDHPGSAITQPRPWEVAAPDRPETKGDEREQPRTRRRVTVSQLLADVPDDAVIVTRRLSKQYGDFTAVENLDLTIRAGEVFGLLGPNGAGKTTTVLMLLGLTEPTRGVVRVVGLDPTREPLGVKRKVGYLPDNVGFYGGMTGRENLRYTAKLNGLAKTEAEARIDELLAEVRLTDAADKKAETYSRGMRQRLGIADALVKNPSVLILDEPTIAIDPAGVEELLALLRRLVKERNLTVLLSSHILGQVQSLCDRVGFFSAGRLVAAGPLDELARGTDRTIQLEVGVDGPPDAIDAVARALPAVRSVEPSPDDERYRIVTATEDVAGPLATALGAAGLSLVHLRRRGTDLLDLYRRFVPEGTDGRAR